MVPWDDSTVWDATPSDFWDNDESNSEPRKRMFEINLNLKNINFGTLITRVRATVTAFLDHTDVFPTPDPELASVTAKANALADTIVLRDAAKASAKALTSEVDELATQLKDLYKGLGSYVGKKATTEAQVNSVLMEVKGKPAPRPVPDRVEGLELSPADHDGGLDSHWDPDSDADHFELETNDDPDNATTWKHKCTCTNSRVQINDLISGARVWVRVRGVNAAGAGPWSDPVARRVP